MRRRVASALSVLLLVVGGVQGGRGAWIYAKAEVAQILLGRSWADTLAGQERVRPWPWADAWPVARIMLPDGDHIVLSGASGRNLAFAPGHLDGTVLPGGAGTCVIAGHRDTHFAILEDLVEGDLVRLEDAAGTVTTYSVTATAVVDESETDVLAESVGPTLVLITCWPFRRGHRRRAFAVRRVGGGSFTLKRPTFERSVHPGIRAIAGLPDESSEGATGCSLGREPQGTRRQKNLQAAERRQVFRIDKEDSHRGLDLSPLPGLFKNLNRGSRGSRPGLFSAAAPRLIQNLMSVFVLDRCRWHLFTPRIPEEPNVQRQRPPSRSWSRVGSSWR